MLYIFKMVDVDLQSLFTDVLKIFLISSWTHLRLPPGPVEQEADVTQKRVGRGEEKNRIWNRYPFVLPVNSYYSELPGC